MNERIRELAEQAGGFPCSENEWGFYNKDLEKFAELIVQECVDVVSEIPIIDNGHPHPAWKIKQHFGIES